MKKIKLSSNEIEQVDNIDSLLSKNHNVFFKIVPILSIAILIFSVYLFIPKKNNLDDNNLYLIIDENRLIKIYENDLYGYINTNGKKVIDTKYTYAEDFIGNYAIVGDEDNYMLINHNGKELFKEKDKDNIKYYDQYNVWIINGNLYDFNLNKINLDNEKIKYAGYGFFSFVNIKNNTVGIMNKDGKKTYTYKLSNDEKDFKINSVSEELNEEFSNYYCILNLDNNKYSIVNCNSGKVIIPYTNELISKNTNSYFDFKMKKNFSFIKKIIIINNQVEYESNNKNETIKEYANYYYINNSKEGYNKYISKIDGKEINSAPSDKVSNTKINEVENYLKIKKYVCDNKYGLKENNKNALECEWDDIYYLDIDLVKYLKTKKKFFVITKKDDIYYLIDYKKNKIVKKFETNYISMNNKSLFIQYSNINNNNKIVYSIAKNSSIEFSSDTNIALYLNYFIVYFDGEMKYYNLNLKDIYKIK